MLRHILICGALVFAAASAQAQTAVRIRGVLAGIEGNALLVKSREGQDLRIAIAPDTAFTYMKKLSLADVKPGTPLGTSAVMGPGGKLIARELHLFAPDRPVPNEGHRPWDLEPGSTMTNGRISAVATAGGGREFTLSYAGGSQQLIVPGDVPVVTAVPGERSQLKVGEYVFIAATLGADDKLAATRVQFTKDGVRPPQ